MYSTPPPPPVGNSSIRKFPIGLNDETGLILAGGSWPVGSERVNDSHKCADRNGVLNRVRGLTERFVRPGNPYGGVRELFSGEDKKDVRPASPF